MINVGETTLCLKKVPTFKLSVTLSNLNRFSKILHCWKAYEISYAFQQCKNFNNRLSFDKVTELKGGNFF